MNGIDELRRLYPWPDSKPDVPLDGMGWFHGDTGAMLNECLPSDGVVVELGTWLGLSAQHIVRHSTHLVCIDTWLGSPEHFREELWRQRLPTLYETCQANLWDHRDKITLVRLDAVAGLAQLYLLGIRPTLIYVDADHEEAPVLAHLLTCHTLFPSAAIVGDDWPFPPTQKSALYFSEITKRPIRHNDAAYAFRGLT